MAVILLRSSKSTALTHSEMDGNFSNLNTRTTTLETNYIKTINSLTATNNTLTITTTNITEGTNLYYTDTRARASISVTDSGGDGSLSYNSSTGVVTYTGPSAAEVRAHFTAGEGIDITAGAISGEDATAANKGIASFSSDHFDISSGAVTLKANGIDDTHIDWGTGTAQVSTADIPENTNLYYTNARADARITAASIADLSNVTMASLVNGYGLVYNSSSSQIELAELPGAAGGEANQGSNLGGFNEVFKSKTSVTLQFRTLTHDNNITITQSTNYLTIGLGTISSLVATTADINAGTVDAVIGGTTPAAGSFTTINASGVATAVTFEPTADTSASDNAAIGYTSAEGLILTGQGSTSDITFKNDADTTVFTIPTGTDDILFPDNAKAMWGASSDFVIYHSSADSSTYLEESGSGSIYIKASNFYIQDASGTEHIRTVDDSYVMLFHNGSEKLATSSAGGTLTGTWETTTALVPDASDGAALGTTSLEWSDLYLADGAVIGFGDNQDVTLTHVHDTGLLLNGAMQLQFSDASQYINAPSATVLDINATDEIELNATLVDINANVEISGTATTTGVHTFTAVPVLPANSIDSDHYVDGSIDNAHIADDAIDSEHYAADSIDEEHIANDAVGSAELKTLSTLLIKDSSGSTLKTLYGAGA